MAGAVDSRAAMTVDTSAVGKTWDPADFEVEADRITAYADAVGEDNPVHRDAGAAKAAGFRDVVAPPMFAVVYSAPAMGPPILEVIAEKLPLMVHGGQEFVWGAPVCAGDTITTTADCQGDLRKGRQGLLRLREPVGQPGRRGSRARHLDQHRQRRLSAVNVGDSIPELKVTPDDGLTKRYAEASGDPNPIHTDPEFAKSVGLPGVILHGLYSMAQVARANTAAAGGDRRSSNASRSSSAAWASRSRRSPSAATRQGGARRASRGRHRRRAVRQPDHPQRRSRARGLSRPRAGGPRGVSGTMNRWT